MNRHGRSQLALGIILILAGVWFFLDKTTPQIHTLFARYTAWPLNMFLIGGGILLFGLLTSSPGLAVPAAIVAGVGGIAYYQDLTNNAAWYTWVLLLGCIGLGNLIAGLLGENSAHNIRHGLKTMVVSVVIFLALATVFGDLNLFGKFGPAILLILLGVWLLGNDMYRAFRRKEQNSAE